eukprot:GFYU01022281.1.p1 GENE.GFYU01022281.1~~GFYU01022281.1.p1  ORF type:complete len:246 (+),score=71.17 GFYU01022281.1:125-862(+)
MSDTGSRKKSLTHKEIQEQFGTKRLSYVVQDDAKPAQGKRMSHADISAMYGRKSSSGGHGGRKLSHREVAEQYGSGKRGSFVVREGVDGPKMTHAEIASKYGMANATRRKSMSLAPMEKIKKFYDCAQTKEFGQMAGLLSEDVKWVVYGPNESPLNGHFSGTSSVGGWLRKCEELYKTEKITPENFYNSDLEAHSDKWHGFHVSGRSNGTMGSTGEPYSMQFADTWLIDDSGAIIFRQTNFNVYS